MTRIRIDIRGRSFEADLPLGHAVRVGRQAGLELTLDADGVAAVHCTLEALPDGRVRLVDGGSGQPTRRNGAVVKQAALSEGDVVELGTARIAVGAPALDAAAPAAPPPPAEFQGQPRAARRSAPSEGSARASAGRARAPSRAPLYVVGAIVVVGALAGLFLMGGGEAPVARDPRLLEAKAHVDAGRLAAAGAVLDALETAARDPDAVREMRERIARLAVRIEAALEDLEAVRLDKNDDMLAAHRRDLIARFGEDAGPRMDAFIGRVHEARAAWLQQRAEAIGRDTPAWQREHRFDLWRAAWDTVERSAPVGVDAREWVAAGRAEVEAAASAMAQRLLAEGEDRLERGLSWQAVDGLERVVAGYAGFPEHADLVALLARAREAKARPYEPEPGAPEAGTPPAPAPGTTPPEAPPAEVPEAPTLGVEGALAAARAVASEALDKRAFGAAAEAARGAADAVPAGAPRAAVEALAADLARAHSGFERLVAAIGADPKPFRNVPVGGRLRVDVRKADAVGFDAAVQGGESRFVWARVATATWEVLLERLHPEGEAAFEVACLARALDLQGQADRWLVAAGAGGFDEPSLFRVVARWRGEDLPADGYVAYDGRYVTHAERDWLEREKAIVAALGDLDASRLEVRRAAYDRLLELGVQAAERFATALKARRARIVDALAAAPAWTSTKTKARLFAELERRRAHALDLIRDEAAYPYPNPEHLSQAEVELRVDAVRQVWERPFELIVAWDERLAADLEALSEVDEVLVRVDPAHDASLEALAQRVNAAVDMPAVVPEAGAARNRAYSLEVLAFNTKVATTATPQERDNVLAVNEYRMMMGLVALKIHERLLRAARGHSRHMLEGNYFDHNVPADKGRTNENHTPGARAKAQGYGGGVGENIAMGLDSGRDAFRAWFTSSGHHRNMLGAGWTEMACGRQRAYWTQLFGAMTGRSLDAPDPLPAPPPYFAPQDEGGAARRDRGDLPE